MSSRGGRGGGSPYGGPRGGRGGGRGGRGGGGGGGERRGGNRMFTYKSRDSVAGIDEEFRIQVQRALTEFRTSDEQSVTFPSTLTAAERKYVHFAASQLGLESKSSGKGEARQLTVRVKATARRSGPGAASAAAAATIPAPRLLLSPPGEDRLLGYLRGQPPALGDWYVHETIRALAALHMGHLFRPRRPAATAATAGRGGGPRPLGGLAAAPPLPAPTDAERARWEATTAARVSGPRAREYAASLASRRALPSWSVREAVAAALRCSQVVIVSGDTGCGKSTQVPQFILDDAALGPAANIIVTQPRRISAISLAERVASERAEEVGGAVGYNVRLESATSDATRLLFCTTGVLLRRLTSDPLLAGVTHVVLDEVHERDVNTDFLLIILRALLPARPTLRLVVMSATLQLDLYLAYFKATAAARGVAASPMPAALPATVLAPDVAMVHVVGSAFPVTRYFLEDVLDQTGFMAGGGGGHARAAGGARLALSLESAFKAQQATATATRAAAAADPAAGSGDGGLSIAVPAMPLPSSSSESAAAAAEAATPSYAAAAAAAASLPPSSAARALAASLSSAAGPAPAPRDTQAIGAPVAAECVCAMCGRERFRSLEDFAVHAALCFGPGTAGDEDDDEEAAAAAAAAPADIAPTAAEDEPALAEQAAPAPTPAAAAAAAVATPSSSSLVLPGGIRAKKAALAAAAAAYTPEAAAAAAAAGSPSSGTTVGLTTGVVLGPSSLHPERAEDLLDGYLGGVDDDAVDIELLVRLLAHIVQSSLVAGAAGHGAATPGPSTGFRTPLEAGLGAVLVFLPGWEDISAAMEAMRGHPVLGNTARVVALPLHSAIPTSEQRRVFKRPPPGVVKVVLSTNIAETSLTIDDIVYVVDGGKTKEKTFDAYTGCSSLASVWVSQASARQRAGRAGRVRPGISYHLFSRKRHAAMAAFAVPEMLRTPLDELCLQIKLLQLTTPTPAAAGAGGAGSAAAGAAVADEEEGSDLVAATCAGAAASGSGEQQQQQATAIERFLTQAVQPPPAHAVRAAVQLLHDIGALAPLQQQQLQQSGASRAGPAPSAAVSAREDELTPLGYRLAHLPVSPRFGKMILLAALFRCLDPVLTVACAMSYRPPWVLPMHAAEKRLADDARRRLARGARSDHLALLNAYTGFQAARAAGGGAPFNAREGAFCRENYLSAAALNMVAAMREQLVRELVACGALAHVAAAGTGAAAAATPAAARGGGRVGGVGDKAASAVLAAASVNGGNTALVLSVVAAGLYPHVARVNPGGGGGGRREDEDDAGGGGGGSFASGAGAASVARLAARPGVQTRGNKRTVLHPTSVAAARGFGASPPGAGVASRGVPGGLADQSASAVEWLVFDEMGRQGSFGVVSVRGVTAVPALALLFLCGKPARYAAAVREALRDADADAARGGGGESGWEDASALLLGEEAGGEGEEEEEEAPAAAGGAGRRQGKQPPSQAPAAADPSALLSAFEKALVSVVHRLTGAQPPRPGAAGRSGGGGHGHHQLPFGPDGMAAAIDTEMLLDAAVDVATAAAGGAEDAEEDGDEEGGGGGGGGRSASRLAEVAVDDWVAFGLPAAQALALVIVRNRLALAFHRTVVIPEASTALPAPHACAGGDPAHALAAQVAADRAVVQLAAAVLSQEVLGSAAGLAPAPAHALLQRSGGSGGGGRGGSGGGYGTPQALQQRPGSGRSSAGGGGGGGGAFPSPQAFLTPQGLASGPGAPWVPAAAAPPATPQRTPVRGGGGGQSPAPAYYASSPGPAYQPQQQYHPQHQQQPRQQQLGGGRGGGGAAFVDPAVVSASSRYAPASSPGYTYAVRGGGGEPAAYAPASQPPLPSPYVDPAIVAAAAYADPAIVTGGGNIAAMLMRAAAASSPHGSGGGGASGAAAQQYFAPATPTMSPPRGGGGGGRGGRGGRGGGGGRPQAALLTPSALMSAPR